MLKVLKLLKLAKRLRMAVVSKKVIRDSWTSIPGVDFLGGQPIFLAICGKNSRVPFIPECRNSRVTSWDHRVQEICGAVERDKR